MPAIQRNVLADVTDHRDGERDTVIDVVVRLETAFVAYKQHCDTEALLDALSEALIIVGPESQTTALLRSVFTSRYFEEVCERAQEAHSRALREWLTWQVKTQAYVGLDIADVSEQRREECALRMRVLANDAH